LTVVSKKLSLSFSFGELASAFAQPLFGSKIITAVQYEHDSLFWLQFFFPLSLLSPTPFVSKIC
jgi:hypothetical protein